LNKGKTRYFGKTFSRKSNAIQTNTKAFALDGLRILQMRRASKAREHKAIRTTNRDTKARSSRFIASLKAECFYKIGKKSMENY